MSNNIFVRKDYKPAKESNNLDNINVLILGGSTSDPMGTHFSGYRGTWIHHLFGAISQNEPFEFIVDNAGNGGSTSSNELL